MDWRFPTALVLVVAAPAAAFDLAFNFQRAGTVELASAGACGITVSSSFGANPVDLSPSGLGHVGGASDLDIDPGESMDFGFAHGPGPGVGYRVAAASNQDGDGSVGESFVEAFAGNTSLGVETASGVGTIDVSALFGGAAISRFRVTALETIRISRAQWRLEPGVAVTADVAVGGFSPAYTFASPLLQCGVRVETGDGLFHVAAGGDGLGIVGGASDRVDAGESLIVLLGEPFLDLEYRLTDSTDVGGTFESGDHFVEAFDANGASLGLRAASDNGDLIDLTALYGGAAIQSFELLAVSDSFRLSSVRLVPEPAAGTTLAALAALAWIARPRRDSRPRASAPSSSGVGSR